MARALRGIGPRRSLGEVGNPRALQRLPKTVGRLGSGATKTTHLPAGASRRRLRYGAPSEVLGRDGALAKSGTLAPYNASRKL